MESSYNEKCDDLSGSIMENDIIEYPIRAGELILDRFVVESLLGGGSFGKVMGCYDRLKQRCVALKVLHHREGVNQMANDELTVLKRLNLINVDGKYPFVSLLKSFIYNDYVFMVFPLFQKNLYEFMSDSKVKGISLRIVRSIAEQLLEGLDKLRELGLIHCDLKPENIMLVNDTKCRIKIIDFGSANSVYSKVTYTYIQSRLYRAPEIILQLNYKCSIDMWSLATILVELHCGSPLFEGENEHDQLVHIVNLLGMPPLEMVWKSPMIFRYFEVSPEKTNFVLISTKTTQCIPESTSLERIFEKCRQSRVNSQNHTPYKYETFINFLQKILTIDPQNRIHPNLAKSHPFIDDKYNSSSSNEKSNTSELPRGSFVPDDVKSKNGSTNTKSSSKNSDHSEPKFVDLQTSSYQKELNVSHLKNISQKSIFTCIKPLFSCTSNEFFKHNAEPQKNGARDPDSYLHFNEENTESTLTANKQPVNMENIAQPLKNLNIKYEI